MAILFLPDIFDVRPDAQRITVRNNHIHDNNKPNTAAPGSILSTVPPGIGILHVGVDDSRDREERRREQRLRRHRHRRLLPGGGRWALRLLGRSRDHARASCSTMPPSNNQVIENVAREQRRRTRTPAIPSRSRPATSRWSRSETTATATRTTSSRRSSRRWESCRPARSARQRVTREGTPKRRWPT